MIIKIYLTLVCIWIFRTDFFQTWYDGRSDWTLHFYTSLNSVTFSAGRRATLSPSPKKMKKEHPPLLPPPPLPPDTGKYMDTFQVLFHLQWLYILHCPLPVYAILKSAFSMGLCLDDEDRIFSNLRWLQSPLWLVGLVVRHLPQELETWGSNPLSLAESWQWLQNYYCCGNPTMCLAL